MQAFPPNTGVGWHTMATGTWPGEHGSTNNTFHRTGRLVRELDLVRDERDPAGRPHRPGRRARRQVRRLDGVGRLADLSPALNGPVVDFRSFFSNRGIVAELRPARAARARERLRRLVPARRPRPGRRLDVGAPASYSPARQEQLTLTNTVRGTSNVDRIYDLYIYDSTERRRDELRQACWPSPRPRARTLPRASTLGVGDWADVKLQLVGPRAGQTAGFYLKLDRPLARTPRGSASTSPPSRA